jgi:hypothetical protein
VQKDESTNPATCTFRLTADGVLAAVRALFAGELQRLAVREAERALDRKKLIFPQDVVAKQVTAINPHLVLDARACTCLTAVIEYVAAEFLELGAAEAAKPIVLPPGAAAAAARLLCSPICRRRLLMIMSYAGSRRTCSMILVLAVHSRER